MKERYCTPIWFYCDCERERVQSIDCGGEVVEVWYLGDSGSYEWVRRDPEGRIVDGSEDGYTMLAVALQAGLNQTLGVDNEGDGIRPEVLRLWDVHDQD